MKTFIAVLSTLALIAGSQARTLRQSPKDLTFLPPGSKIINGQDAELGEWPFIVRLGIKVSAGTALCGGTLIAPDLVLTAGHCVDGATSAEITAGDLHTSPFIDEPTEQTRTSTNLVQHEGYNGNTIENDVAVIKLDTPFDISDNLKPISLPSESPVAGQQVVQAGWGLTSDLGFTAETLQWIEISVVDISVCEDRFGAEPERYVFCLQNNDGSSACRGDSGGPTTNLEKTEVYGATSFGGFLCDQGPAAMSDIFRYKDWICEKAAGYDVQGC